MSETGEAARPKLDYRVMVLRGGYSLDVTNAVADCFDIAINSMDFGSGFLSTEEVNNLRALAVALGVETKRFDIYKRGEHN